MNWNDYVWRLYKSLKWFSVSAPLIHLYIGLNDQFTLHVVKAHSLEHDVFFCEFWTRASVSFPDLQNASTLIISTGHLHLDRSFSCLVHPTLTPQYCQVCIKPSPFSFRALTGPLLPSFINSCHCLLSLCFYLVFSHSNRPSKDWNEAMIVAEYSTFNIYSALFSIVGLNAQDNHCFLFANTVLFKKRCCSFWENNSDKYGDANRFKWVWLFGGLVMG